MAQISEFFRRWARGRGVAVAEQLAAEIRELISDPYPPASRPGRPPHRRTGKLLRSVKVVRTLTGARVQIGKDAIYASFLESGTRFMKARPFLSTAMRRLKIKKYR
jgi:HK97 gp10 family phage protein